MKKELESKQEELFELNQRLPKRKFYEGKEFLLLSQAREVLAKEEDFEMEDSKNLIDNLASLLARRSLVRDSLEL